jgi:hypothetical protein
VDHQRRVADESQKVGHHLGEDRMLGQELGRQTMHPECLFRHIPFRVDVFMEYLAGRQLVDQLDAADFHQPVAGGGIKAGGFGVEHNLAMAGLGLGIHGASWNNGLTASLADCVCSG